MKRYCIHKCGPSVAFAGVVACWSMFHVCADVHYVAQNDQGPAHPYTNWSTAASTIQQAVDAADAGDTVLLGDGVYTSAVNPIASISKALTLRGASGNREAVVLEGPALTDPSTVMRGILVSAPAGSRILIDSLTITNCTSSGDGAGMYFTGTAPCTTEVRNCVITHSTNRLGSSGGTAMYSAHPYLHLNGCLIKNNVSSNRNYAGGSFVGAWTLIEDCVFSANASLFADRGFGINIGSGIVRRSRFEKHREGGIWGVVANLGNDVLMENCVVVSNSSAGLGGGYFGLIRCEGSTGTIIRNCLIADNAGGAKGWDYVVMYQNADGRIENCTIVNNHFGVYVRNSGDTGVVVNCIVRDQNGADVSVGGTLYATNNCSDTALSAYGPGNITDDPLFQDAAEGNYRLSRNSPARNAGTNLDWMVGFRDLDGFPRIDSGPKRVDMGCYEWPYRDTIIMVR